MTGEQQDNTRHGKRQDNNKVTTVTRKQGDNRQNKTRRYKITIRQDKQETRQENKTRRDSKTREGKANQDGTR